MKLNQNEYRNKLLGCWLGKNVGGTLGAPDEWHRRINNLAFYTQPDLNGNPMANDDLDIQLLWILAMEEKGINVTTQRLAEYFCLYVVPHWGEYGMGKINMHQGLLPPMSGSFQNVHRHSCGSYIRSEIWACIAPGLPAVAARYAYEDAIIDHGNGEGTYAEIFMAALESAAFFISDLRELIDIGLSYIPKECGVAQAVHTTLACFDAGKSWVDTRHEVLRLHRGKLADWCVSAEDKARGFDTGVVGYDVPSNIAITLIGLLWGGDDFSQVECIAVNCGEDTDCTAATAGSIWGIIHGAAAIPQKWLDPIGRNIKTICLNIADLNWGKRLPQTVDDLTDRTARLCQQVLTREKAQDLCGEGPTDLKGVTAAQFKVTDEGRSIWGGFNGTRFDFDFFKVHVDYGNEGAVIRDSQPKSLTVRITNTYLAQANLSLHWYLPEGWQVTPSPDGYANCLPVSSGLPELKLEYKFMAPKLTRTCNRAALEITIEGRPTVMLVPVMLLNGNMLPEVMSE
jgi:ADP-ribosylglycohydrolase